MADVTVMTQTPSQSNPVLKDRCEKRQVLFIWPYRDTQTLNWWDWKGSLASLWVTKVAWKCADSLNQVYLREWQSLHQFVCMQDVVYSLLVKVLFPQNPLHTDPTGASDKAWLPLFFLSIFQRRCLYIRVVWMSLCRHRSLWTYTFSVYTSESPHHSTFNV